MKRFAAALWSAALIGLASCSTTPDTPAALARANSVQPGGLPAQQLALGECGLFLFSLSGEPRFIFFSKAGTDEARMVIVDQEETLSLQSRGGDVFGQFTTEQQWLVPRTSQRVDVSVVAGEPLVAGQQVPSGRLKVTDPNGWEMIIPVSGVRACQVDLEGDPPMGF